ncbi:TetR family transcriptional regulator [Luteipulveratus sp. YIM 133132]|uniref:TetR/AcrR family transcriptional regulator n=1 Tax=Luteipulveratus flavus TaxID=3031728 RepID=UPI0023AEA23C|nr:TetR family transcriptional regulator [Luteipulveratus sp. YIM 133132]MDE9367812.1 TetR family transcriptional regulator [Luteipulveratus sp. YIM 133132]
MTARDQVDRRTTRWDEHREQRRAGLIEAAVRTIDRLGPDASVAEMAREAQASKPVLYRYFADKNEVHAAVAAWGSAKVAERVLPALITRGPMRERIGAAVDGYLSVIEEHPSVFRLLIHHRADGDILAAEKSSIAAALAGLMAGQLRHLGLDTALAEPWSHAIVGLCLTTGEWWLDTRTMTRAEIGGHLSLLIWHALAGIVQEKGGDASLLDSGASPSPSSDAVKP